MCYIFTLLYDLYHNHVARFVTTLLSLLTEINQTFLEHWMRGAETDSSWNCFVHFITDLHYWRFKLIQTPKCTTSNRRRPSQLRISDPNIISLPRVSMNYYQIPIFIAFVSYLWLVFQWIIRGFSMNALCLWSDGVVRLHQQITGERKLLNKMLDYHCDVFIWGDISWPGGHDLHIHDISAHVLLWLHCHHWTEVSDTASWWS